MSEKKALDLEQLNGVSGGAGMNNKTILVVSYKPNLAINRIYTVNVTYGVVIAYPGATLEDKIKAWCVDKGYRNYQGYQVIG